MNRSAALDDDDFEAVSTELQQSASFSKCLIDDVRTIWAALGITNGLEQRVLARFAMMDFGEVRRLPRGTTRVVSAVDAEGLGRMFLLCVGAQYVADYRHAPLDRVMYSLLATDEEVPFEPSPCGSPDRLFLGEFMANAVEAAYGVIFRDQRRTNPRDDWEFCLAVAAIVRHEKRAVTKTRKRERWAYRLARYRETSPARSQAFAKSTDAPKAFRQAFVRARERLRKAVGAIERFEKIDRFEEVE